MEDLKQKTDNIRELIASNPELAADLMIDLARDYSTNEEIQDELILLKLEIYLDETEEELEAGRARLRSFLDQIIEEYNPEKLAEKQQEEKALTEKVIHIAGPLPIVLEAEDLTRKYPSTGFTLEAKQFSLQQGHITGLLGENATGKTTLFNILAGRLIKTSGSLTFPIFEGGKKLNWFKLQPHIAYVPQELPAWKDGLLDTLHHHAALHGISGKDNDRAVTYVIQRLSLQDHVDKSWHQLSGGYKLRFSLAKALVTGPPLLLLDEPLANLDIKTQQLVLNDLYYLTRSRTNPLTVFISSQHIHEVEAVADWLYYMDNGALEDLGPTSQYGQDRDWNVYELSTPVSTKAMMRAIADFPHRKHWATGVHFFVTTPLEIKGEELIAHLASKDIPVSYFRDISTSVKTRFYETQLL